MKRRNFFKALAGAIGAGPALVKAAAVEAPVPAVTVTCPAATAATIGGKSMSKILMARYSLGKDGVFKEISQQAWTDVEGHEDAEFLTACFTSIEQRS